MELMLCITLVTDFKKDLSYLILNENENIILTKFYRVHQQLPWQDIFDYYNFSIALTFGRILGSITPGPSANLYSDMCII